MTDSSGPGDAALGDGHRPIVVLLIDDHAFIGAVVSRMLAGERDIEFHHCLSALDAVDTAARVAPTIILQDLVMPDMDGLDVLAALRADARTAATPVIIFSANDDAQDRARAKAAGADGYLVKVPKKPELVACIRSTSRR